MAYTQTFATDGTTFAYETKYPISFIPTITLDGVAQTVKTAGVDPWAQAAWYWTPEHRKVFRGDSAAPAGGHTLAVIYEWSVTNIATTSSPDSVSAMATASAGFGSGIWERVRETPGVDTQAEATAGASLVLARESVVPVTFMYETDLPGLAINMTQPVNIPRLNINATYIVTSIQSKANEAPLKNGSVFRRQVTVALIGTAPAQVPAVTSPPIVNPFNPPTVSTILEQTNILTQQQQPQIQREIFASMFDPDDVGVIGGTIKNRWTAIRSGTLDQVIIDVVTMATGQILAVDLLVNGASVLFRGRPAQVTSTQTFINAFISTPLPFRIKAGDKIQGVAAYLIGSGSQTDAVGVTLQASWAI